MDWIIALVCDLISPVCLCVSLYFKTESQEWRPVLTLILVLFFMIIVTQYTQHIFYISYHLHPLFRYDCAIGQDRL